MRGTGCRELYRGVDGKEGGLVFILSARSRPPACHSTVVHRLLQKEEREATAAAGRGLGCREAAHGTAVQPRLLDTGLRWDQGGLRVRQRSASGAKGWLHGKDRPGGIHRGRPGSPFPAPHPHPRIQQWSFGTGLFFFFFFERKKEWLIPLPKREACGLPCPRHLCRREWTEPQWLHCKEVTS